MIFGADRPFGVDRPFGIDWTFGGTDWTFGIIDWTFGNARRFFSDESSSSSELRPNEPDPEPPAVAPLHLLFFPLDADACA